MRTVGQKEDAFRASVEQVASSAEVVFFHARHANYLVDWTNHFSVAGGREHTRDRRERERERERGWWQLVKWQIVVVDVGLTRNDQGDEQRRPSASCWTLHRERTVLVRQVFHGREDTTWSKREREGRVRGRRMTKRRRRRRRRRRRTRRGATREEYTTWFLLRSRDVPPASHSFWHAPPRSLFFSLFFGSITDGEEKCND